LIRPYKITEPLRLGALWFLAASSMLVGLLDWLPYSHRRYDTQIFFAAIGAMSGFFIAWCCVAAGLMLQARRARVRTAKE
jgi:hypothetical protein